MARDRYQELNETQQEAPGGTQATHSATNPDFGGLSEDLGEETRNTSVQSDLAMDGATGARARLQAAAKPVVHRAGRAVETGTDYLRSHDFEEIRGDLEREIRAHPIKSIAIALGARYLLGKIFR